MDGVTKRCCTCGQERPLSDFNRRASSEDGLQFRCRACSREWYERNKIAHVQNVVRRNRGFRVQLTALMGDYLLGHPCVDCGEADIRCLEFDHRCRQMRDPPPICSGRRKQLLWITRKSAADRSTRR
jgi:hypothetical protein